MNWVSLALLSCSVLLLCLLFLSLLEACIAQISRVSLRALAEKRANARTALLSEVAADRRAFLLPVQFASHGLQIVLAVLMTALVAHFRWMYWPVWALSISIAVILVFSQLIPKGLCRFGPERLLLLLLPFLRPGYPLLRIASLPVLWVSRDEMGGNGEKTEWAEEEATEEEIQAYIGVGEEEGIFEEEESELIQSALEFGNTLVREIMTPRSEITAIEEGATISELKELMVTYKHSRIPVYREQMDQIVGVVYVRNLLAYLEEGKGDDTIRPLVHRPWFVPETKKVAKLLKEMQRAAEHLVIVINEYGAVSGLVTVEDLVEEIVGEIRDEDEPDEPDLVYEGKGNYFARGGVEIRALAHALGVELEGTDVTTLSGLVVSHLGKVPVSGEKVKLSSLHVEVLSADRKRIHTLRVCKLADESEADAGLGGSPASATARKA